MNCQDIQKFAFTYLDCEFDSRERGEFEAHLEVCCGCRKTVERDAMFKGMVASHLQQPCDARLKERVHGVLQRAHRRKVSRSVAFPVVVVVGVAVAGVVAWQLAVVDSPVAQTHVDIAAQPDLQPVVPQTLAPVQKLQPPARIAGVGLARKPVARVVLGQKNDGPVAAQGAQVQLASATMEAPAHLGEVLGGGLAADALVQRSPFGAVRSPESLRAMSRVHAAQQGSGAGLPPEITGNAAKIQRYLAQRVPGLGPLPLSEGAGVQLTGARIAMIGSQPVVVYAYVAYGVPLTVFSRAKATRDLDDPEIEAQAPDARGPAGILLDRQAGLQLLHVVSYDRVLTLVSELGAPALLHLVPAGSTLGSQP